MAPKKRSAPEEEDTTRVAKVAKVVEGAKKKTINAPTLDIFKAKALPLHVNITHTPPTLGEQADEMKTAASEDPGSLGNLTLLPSSFQTGSYGWKGNKRLTIELRDPESGDACEKVQVMLTINATVLGSKQSTGSNKQEVPKDDDSQALQDELDTQEDESDKDD